MARVSRIVAVVLTAVLATFACADPFGRFGYGDIPQVPGFELQKDGFRSRDGRSDWIRFVTKPTIWSVIQTNDQQQTIHLNERYGNPDRLRVELTAPGFSLHFPQGLQLKVNSVAAPYLTWGEGSAAEEVPTPDVPWVVVSFRDLQPPLIIGVPEGRASFQIVGRPGDWTLKSEPFRGWVRLGLPTGLRPVQANTAHALGELRDKAVSLAPLFTQPAPKLVSTKVSGDVHAVKAIWTFDRPGCVVPPPLLLASIGGYAPRVDSNIQELDAPTEEGPLAVTAENQLVVRFPVKRIPTGRAVLLDPVGEEPLATASPFDLPSVVRMAFENLLSDRDAASRKLGERCNEEFLLGVANHEEPHTKQSLPYDSAGQGLDLVAAHSLLNQVLTSTIKPGSEANSLLTSLAWRMDWLNWRLWTADRAVGRRAAAVASMAGALCAEPERRLLAAMLQAGLASERGLQTWSRRRGFGPQETPMLESLEGVRRALFSANPLTTDAEKFGQALLSPIRVYGTVPVELRSKEGLLLQWPAQGEKAEVLTLASGYPIILEPVENFRSFKQLQSFGVTELRYQSEGLGTNVARLKLPDWAKPIPAGIKVPAYSEIVR